MRFPPAAFVLVVLPALAPAQTPPVAASGGNITVEAQEVVRQKPDSVKLFMKVEVRNPDPTQAADEAASEAKAMAEGLVKLKIDGVTVSTPQQRVVRSEVLSRGAPGGGPGVVEYRVIRPVQVVVTNPDPEKFAAAVEKVQLEAFRLNLVSDLATDNYTYNPNGQQEKNAPLRAVYSRKGGWDDLTGPALEKATKKARAKAEALAAGAGVTLGGVLSVTEVTTYPSPPGYNPYNGTAATGEPEDEFADGDLVRKVRVRVVFAAK